MSNQQNIVILTGAGISVESGIPAYRTGDDKLWGGPLAKFNTAKSITENRRETIESFMERKRLYSESNFEPNAAHVALATLEEHWVKNKKGTFTLLTQNVDNLHELAGSQNVFHIHGELSKKRSLDGTITDWEGYNLDWQTERPHIVLFGENILSDARSYHALYSCKLFICIGTSLQVWPASGFIDAVSQMGADSVFINETSEPGDHRFKTQIYKKASTGVVEYVNKLIL